MKLMKLKKIKFKSLTMRIWTTFTLIILIIICGITVLYWGTYRKIDESAKTHDLKVAHDVLLKSNNYSGPPNRFDELKNLRDSDYFIYNINDKNESKIININRNVPPIPAPMHVDEMAIKRWMVDFIKGDNLYEKEFKGDYRGIRFLFIVSSINYGENGKSYLVTYLPNREENGLLGTVIIIGLIFIAIGFLTAKIVAGYISKPLRELEGYTLKIAHKDWKEPITVKSEDEIGRLAESMNDMQRELKRADEEEKMFLQSISHDLKTPVMVIMSHAEAIIDGVYIGSLEKTAEIIKDEAINLEKKIKQMLYLNTLDYVLENSNENTNINLNELILSTVNRFEIIKSSINWELNIENISIIGNADKIKVSIENILDNALRYAESKISISLKQELEFVELTIYNDGPNIDKKHIEHIFKNFYKDKTGNFGLGLAISKRIIDYYKGEIKAINMDKGVSFIIKYPLSIKN